MQTKKIDASKLNATNIADLAREAFKSMTGKGISPTPEAYREAYNAAAGVASQPSAEYVLDSLVDDIANTTGELSAFASRLKSAVQTKDWESVRKNLSLIISDASKHKNPDLEKPIQRPDTKPSVDVSPQMRQILTRLFSVAMPAILPENSEILAENDSIAEKFKQVKSENDLELLLPDIADFFLRIERLRSDSDEKQALMISLFKLLLKNVVGLLDDETWIKGQIASIENLLGASVTIKDLERTTENLKDVIFKQNILRTKLSDSKGKINNMLTTFVDQLNTVAHSTEHYRDNIGIFSLEMSKTEDPAELSKIIGKIQIETSKLEHEVIHSRDEIIAAHQQVKDAESFIKTLESKLEQMSELARVDQLTGSLNRRGMNDVMEREIARSIRRRTSLSIGLLDLDDFKKLNDRFGHQVGDQALIHLVEIIKQTLRTMDVIARFGGEEFIVVLPDTDIAQAEIAVTRIQRELTKQIFMANNMHILMTFSAGVAMLMVGEEQDSIIKRADAALYKAKALGKNRVVSAD
jgi:diguanylate cyclase